MHGRQVERRLLVLVLVVDVRARVDERAHALHVAPLAGDVDGEVVVLVVHLEQLATAGVLDQDLGGNNFNREYNFST